MKVGTHSHPITKHNNHSQRVPIAWPSALSSVESLRETKESMRVKTNAITTQATEVAVATVQAFLRLSRSAISCPHRSLIGIEESRRSSLVSWRGIC